MNSPHHDPASPRPRATLPDAETADAIYLFKYVSRLHATYQIRLNAYRAFKENRRLVIELPEHAIIERSLRQLVEELPNHIVIERCE